MAYVSGTSGNDFIHRAGDGRTQPPGTTEIGTVTTGADTIIAGTGNDTVFGDAGNDTVIFTAATDGADATDLGDGFDIVNVLDTNAQIRLTFTSAEVGNGNANDSGTLANQDSGLALRFQAENGSDDLTGPRSRFDDEGITFVASGGTTFDVRDLVSGVQRGDQFRTVTLGTQMADIRFGTIAADYINGGQGNDRIFGGSGNDFLVGGAGNDVLSGSLGDDSFIGGGGSDTVTGGKGDDAFIFNAATDGADSVNLASGRDTVTVNTAMGAATNVRLTFTSAEVGNGKANDSDSMDNQDGGLAVRLQAEDDGVPLAETTRLDDEGTTFVAGAGVTFDVRDLVSGAGRGEQFEVVTLGTRADDTLTAVQAARPYYINAGGGDDRVHGGTGDDFLVGGAGNDRLRGLQGDDSFIGGAGKDRIEGGSGDDVLTGGDGRDSFVFNSRLDGRSNVDVITDFAAEDVFELSNSVFRGLREGKLESFRLKEVAFETQTKGVDKSDRIIYEKDDGELFFDRDGSGSKYERVKFAEVADNTNLTSSDFLVI